MFYGLALLAGIVAGSAALTAPAAVSWAAQLIPLNLEGSWLAFMPMGNEAMVMGDPDGELPAGSVAVANGDTVHVGNFAGADAVNGKAVITAGALQVNLPTGDAIVATGVGLVVPVTGAFVTTITPTVVNGVITGFVLS